MPSHEFMGQLSESLRNLVVLATKDAGSGVFGTSEKDAAEVKTWLVKASKGDLLDVANIKSLDAHLISRTYLVSNYLTAADIAIYGALYPVISKEQSEQYYSHPSVTRYFDQIQTDPQVRIAADSILPPFPLVSFDIENAPKPTRSTEPPKKKEKAPKNATESVIPSSGANAAVPAPPDSSRQKEDKKEKEPKQKGKEAAPSHAGGKKASGKSGDAPTSSDSSTPVPSMIDLRVGHILEIKKHPEADGLYVEQVDLGEETGPRTVISGLVNYIPIEEMRDRWIITVCNLKPVNMRGIKSHAMILCATHKDGRESGIAIVDPPKNTKPGDRVYFEAPYENDKPLDQLNPKKKIFETIQPGFTILESREAAWVNPLTKTVHRLRTHKGSDGVCLVPSKFVGASLS